MEARLTFKEKHDSILNLPLEVFENIVSYLDIKDLATVQLVSKVWRQAVVGRRPFHQLACDLLKVSQDAYGTREEAIRINRGLMFSIGELFTLAPVSPHLQGFLCFLDCYSDDQNAYICALEGVKGEDLISIERVSHSNDHRMVQLGSFRAPKIVHCMKYYDNDTIVFGSEWGFVQRRDISGQVSITYEPDGIRSVNIVCACVQRDILFKGTGDHAVACCRLSTGDLLHYEHLHAFYGPVVEIKLIPPMDTDSPLYLAVLNHENQCSTPGVPTGKTLSVYTWSEHEKKMTRIYELFKLKDNVGVLGHISPCSDGFRFVFVENWDDIYVYYYSVRSNSVKRQKLLLASLIDQHKHEKLDMIGDVLALGSEYMIFHLIIGKGTYMYLALCQRQGQVWNVLQVFPKIVTGEEGHPQWDVTSQNHQHPQWGFAMGKTDWLNGLNRENMKGLAFAVCYEGTQACVFWKE